MVIGAERTVEVPWRLLLTGPRQNGDRPLMHSSRPVDRRAPLWGDVVTRTMAEAVRAWTHDAPDVGL